MGAQIEHNLPKSLCQELLGKLFRQKSLGELCDVQFVRGRSRRWAHSCVLASFSPFMMRFFVRFLNGDVEWSVRAPIKVDISTLTKSSGKSRNNCMECVSKVVDFIYTGKIRLEPSHIEHIVNISTNLEIENLIFICQKYKSDTERSSELVDDSPVMNTTLNKTVPKPGGQNIVNKSSHSVIEPKNSTEVIPKANHEHGAVKEEENSCSKLSDLHDIEDNSGVENKKENAVENQPHSEEEGVPEDRYSCKCCNVSFPNSLKLHDHEQVYHTRKFSCLQCGFASFKLVYMLKHLTESEHGGRVCSICLFEAAKEGDLKRHLDDHRHRLPFSCHDCGERFKTRTDWIRHTTVHSTDAPFVCKVCNVSFKRSSYLRNHLLAHHTKPKHLCELCGYATPFKSFLTRHKLKHSNKRSVTCLVENCGFATAFEANLKQHMRTHEIDKAFKCHLCNVQFTQDKNLRRHVQLVHNPNMTSFDCPRCTYSNSRIDKVKEHVNSAHPGDSAALEKLREKHETAKRNEVPRLIPKYSRSNLIQKENCRKKAAYEPYPPLRESNSVNSAVEDTLHVPGSLMGGDVSADPIVDASSNSGSKQTVFMSEATGEIAIMSHQEGQPIPVASLTSTNLLTIGNFREGTGSVTLNETTGVLTLNNINSESTGAVFLNESTGELSYINLNNNQDGVQTEDHAEKMTGGLSYCTEFSTLLNEETGEMSTVQEQSDRANNFYDDDMFDSFDIDFFNEDSFDGFDEFDGFLFDTFNPSGNCVEKETTIENFLNEFTGELLKESNRDSNPGVSNNSAKDIWDPVRNFEPSLGLGSMFSETQLNEVTGEFV